MKTYYAVTEGEYSDYRIITITEDKEKQKELLQPTTVMSKSTRIVS